ncbi:MAG: TonB-dependent receptor, partial [Calditrichaceae bacterium]
MYKLFLLLFITVFAVSGLYAGTLAGKVTAKDNGEPLVGANVYLKGTTVGSATDDEGMYFIKIDDGRYDVVCDYVGYATVTKSVQVSGETVLDFELTEFLFARAIDVFADRAKERETPVAYTNVDKMEIENRLGSRDIPLILNATPSVFATDNGGGSGDARINVRGFTQRNMAVMVNGVPVNDMENGWVYWSNWDGLGDATSSIQIQRGLSAVNLATPSIGGTMNILTDPTAQVAGVSYKDEIGSGNFHKRTLFANTGLVDNKFALTLGGVRKTGEGLVDGAWTDAWAYYLGVSYQLNKTNRLELYATGAPQKHGQRRWRLNAATFSHELAEDLGYSNQVLNDPKFAEQGILYNSNWSGVSSSYLDHQYWDGAQRERHDPGFINESENYYHKPIVNLNWYTQFTDKFNLYTTVYYSGGKGGGSGTYGSLGWDYSLQQRVIDYDATIDRNEANIDTMESGRVVKSSRGILRNSVKTHWTIGVLS